MSRERHSPKAPHLWAQKGSARPAGLTGRWPQPAIESEEIETTAPDEPAPSADSEPEGMSTDGEPDELPPAASLLTARRWWTHRAEMETVSTLVPPEPRVQVETEAANPVGHAAAEVPIRGETTAVPATPVAAEEAATRQAPAAESAQTEAHPPASRPPWLSAALAASVVVALVAAIAASYWFRAASPPVAEQADETAAGSAGSRQAAAPESPAVEDKAPPKAPVTGRTETVGEMAGSSTEAPAAPQGAEDVVPDGIAGRVPPPAPESSPVTAADGAAEAAAAATAAPPEKPAYTVQLASVREAAGVEQEWARLQSVLPDILAGRDYRVDGADLDQVGQVYRLRIGAFQGYSEARALCERIRARGQPCLVVPR